MKKLMIGAVVAVAASGAIADPLVYEFKAAIKQINLKEKIVKVGGASIPTYVKIQSSAALTGYLIQDTDGATSPTIQGLAGSGNSVPATRPGDYGRNTAFLVVQNTKAPKEVRFPKILPALIDTRWIDNGFASKNGIAEGYLYIGGDTIGNQIRPSLDLYNGVKSENGRPAAKGFIGDNCWTSVYLFGLYNGPQFFTGLWNNIQAAIDAAHPADLQQPFTPGSSYFYHDTWMNGSGIGKYSVGKTTKGCCGWAANPAGKTLETMTGNLKGGIFLCTENGSDLTAGYALINGKNWENQFFTERNTDGTMTFDGAGDIDQEDLWQDGDLELNTRDVINGTWSIKRTTKLKPMQVTAAELAALGAAGATEDANGLDALMNTIKGAALKLNKNVKFATGKEIWKEVDGHHSQVSFLTPQFCRYYGLLNYK